MTRQAIIKEATAAGYAGKATHAQLNTADPGATGANATGSRVAITWTAGSVDGVYTGTAAITVGSGIVVTHCSLWDAISAGNFCDSGALPASYTGPGTYTLTVTFTEP
jgi:Flp pilus assembly protein TadG